MINSSSEGKKYFYQKKYKKALEILAQYDERELFLRGFFHETGLRTSYVNFDVKPRALGTSKFNFVLSDGPNVTVSTWFSVT